MDGWWLKLLQLINDKDYDDKDCDDEDYDDKDCDDEDCDDKDCDDDDDDDDGETWFENNAIDHLGNLISDSKETFFRNRKKIRKKK